MRSNQLSNKHASLFRCAFALAAVFGALSAAAQQSSTDAAHPADKGATASLEEIIVVAQKRAENSQKIPIAVSSTSGDELRASVITNTLQLPIIDPALQVQNTAGSMETRIRGVGTISDGPGVENPVALYVDGVYYASQLMGGQSLEDASQVSILKGPQGTLFGRNATGGVIQITTRDPTHDRHVEATTDLDNFL